MERIITGKIMTRFRKYLREEEKSKNTVEKYLRDVAAFAEWLDCGKVTREKTIAFKQELVKEGYAVRSVNSILASLNSLFSFLGWADCKAKALKLQRQVYCPEEKELTKEEYERLCRTAQKRHNERLNLILQTLCGTGIRVGELHFITVEAVKSGEAVVSLKGKTRTCLLYTSRCV